MSAETERSSVEFLSAGRHAEVARGATVLDAATHAGIIIPAPCGGRGACGRCAVTVLEGDLEPPEERELAALARARIGTSEVRLACMARVAGDVTVRPLVTTTQDPAVAADGRAQSVVAGVDLGTTTVAVQLVDVTRHTVVGSARVFNRQAAFGADVLSRIAASLGGAGEQLMAAAEGSVLEALALARGDRPGAVLPVRRIVLVGNTAMVSLLAGADVAGLAAHPFSHALAGMEQLTGARLAAGVGDVEIVVVPPVAAFVGGDLVAGLIAEGLAEEAIDALFIDLGTNAEVAAVAGGRLVVASAPAGPAFEGWGIACGGQAGPGGVVRVLPADARGGLRSITDEGPPSYLTGSGLISAVAHLRRVGHLDADGLLKLEGPAQDRFFSAEGVRAVALGEDPLERRVFLSQLDVRALQSAKAAVCVAIRAVTEAAGVGALREVVVTGAFGGALESRDLVDLGIVPKEAAGVLRHVPEAALRGAAAMALDPGLFEEARALASRADHVDLAMGESFTDEFVAALRLESFSL